MADLIKTVRSLDQDGPGANGENLANLWAKLAESSDRRFHAAEESTLRWLLKSMNSPSQAAETLRRYPLTWTILETVFRRIPLFSLAKSLADRRFLAILQQTLKEMSTPRAESSAQTSSKRKRPGLGAYALEDLQSSESCLLSGQAVFGALETLLQRLSSSIGGFSHDRIGAEHIKSLFNLTASDAVSLVAPALVFCNHFVQHELSEHIEECDSWIQTINSVWDLHLQGSDDTYQIATNVFGPVVLLLDKLEGGLSLRQDAAVSEGWQKRWVRDLRVFMRRGLIAPARSIYIASQALTNISDALISTEDYINKSAPVLYSLVADVSDSASQRGSRKVHDEWLKEVFKAVRNSLRKNRAAAATLQRVFSQASLAVMPIALEDLRAVCQELALGDDVDWQLIASISKCDPDVFQKGQAGRDLLEKVSSKTLDASATSAENQVPVSDVIESILQGFRTARDFSGFLRLWYQQLCEAERRKDVTSSPWFQVGRKGRSSAAVADLIEKELTPKLLLDVLEWAKTQEVQEQALCLWLSVVSEGIVREEFKDATYKVLHTLLPKIKKSSSPVAALRWRVHSKVIAWSPPEERSAFWEEVKPRLSSVLRKSTICCAEAFEAFKCGCHAWLVFTPNDDNLEEAADLVQTFTQRIADEDVALGDDDCQDFDSLGAEDSEFDEELGLTQYLLWYVRGSSKLQLLHYAKEPVILPIILNSKAGPASLRYIWALLLSNEHNLNDSRFSVALIDYAIETLQTSRKEEWSSDVTRTWLALLNQVPVDALTRPQRESIMSSLMGRLPGKKELKLASLSDWRSLTSLAAKLMSRPTFYEDMEFSHLVNIADLISTTVVRESATDEELLEMIGRYSSMASTAIGQMADHRNERSERYFTGSLDFIVKYKEDDANLKALHLTLLKILIEKSASSSHLAQAHGAAKEALAGRTVSIINEWVADKKLLSKPDVSANFNLLAAVDAAGVSGDLSVLTKTKKSSVRKLEQRSYEAMDMGDVRGWKIQAFLRKHLAMELQEPRPTQLQPLGNLPVRLREGLVREFIASIVAGMEADHMLKYLGDLMKEVKKGRISDGQLVAVQCVVDQLITAPDFELPAANYSLTAAHCDLTEALTVASSSTNFVHICRILLTLLERKPQAIGQWNVELLLSTVASLASTPDKSFIPFITLCKLMELVIKKHRLRLEGHYHILLGALQPLLRNLIIYQCSTESTGDVVPQETKAQAFTRLITLVCEPTAGAVSRMQFSSALDSATDAAKRSAGRHMYLVLMQYVKLQLENDVQRPIREALEPAMNSIFNITPPEGRKILNDAMDGSGRAILREMFKRYTKFGKWSGV